MSLRDLTYTRCDIDHTMHMKAWKLLYTCIHAIMMSHDQFTPGDMARLGKSSETAKSIFSESV